MDRTACVLRNLASKKPRPAPTAMAGLRAMLACFSLILMLAACASPRVENATPKVLSYGEVLSRGEALSHGEALSDDEALSNDETLSPGKQKAYTLAARVDEQGQKVNQVYARVNGIPWPMEGDGTGHYVLHHHPAGCTQQLNYTIEVLYQRKQFLQPGFSAHVYRHVYPEQGSLQAELAGGPAEEPCMQKFGSLFTVDSTEDQVDHHPGDGECATEAQQCTLRAAVMEANASPGHDYIVLPSGRYRLALEGQEFSRLPDDAINDLDITDSITMMGNGWSTQNEHLDTVIDGNQLNRILDIHAPLQSLVSLSHLRLENGSASSRGGAIRNRGKVHGERLFIAGNRITGLAPNGGCDTDFSVHLCPLGGAIYNTGLLTLSQSSLVNNDAGQGVGGAIANVGVTASLVVDKSFMADNHAAMASALANISAELSLSASTLVADGASRVGLVSQSGSLRIADATLAGFEPLLMATPNARVNLVNSLLLHSSPAAAPGCFDEVVRGGHNAYGYLDSTEGVVKSKAGNPCPQQNFIAEIPADIAQFTKPGYHGGPTQTIAWPLPARDFWQARESESAWLCPVADQTGAPQAESPCLPGALKRSEDARVSANP